MDLLCLDGTIYVFLPLTHDTVLVERLAVGECRTSAIELHAISFVDDDPPSFATDARKASRKNDKNGEKMHSPQPIERALHV